MSDPTHILHQATRLHQSGNLPEAEALYRRILAADPSHPQSLHLLGVIAAQTGRPDQAVQLISRALEIKPGFPQAWFNLGNALHDTGQLDEAIAAYGKATALSPGFAEAHRGRGDALRERGRFDDALAALRLAVSLRPDFAAAHESLGIALHKKELWNESVSSFEKAIALQPGAAEVHNNFGITWSEKGEFDSAIACYEAALALMPDHVGANYNLAVALLDTGGVDGAIARFRAALAAKPNHVDSYDALLCALHYHPRSTPQSLFDESEEWSRLYADPRHQSSQHRANVGDPERRLRVGYISPDFRHHPVARFILPLLASTDHAAFEVFCYADGSVADAVTMKIRAQADHWRTISGQTDQQTADAVRRDHIDILVDLSGHTASNRLLVFAQKPAPVQVAYLGYPGTTGLPAIDYRLTDNLADPPGLTDPFHTEQLIRLPGTAWCFMPPAEAPPVRPLPAIRNRYVTFGSFNNVAKVNEPLVKLWADILRSAPRSRLVLKSRGLAADSARQRVRQWMSQSGIDQDRIELSGYVDWSDHLARYGEIDIALDTFPYHGTTTTCEALWMGVPVVTLAGPMHVSRVGVSLLSSVGLADLVARDDETYVRLAVDLSRDLARLGTLRTTMRQRMQDSPLMDADRFARDVESAYRSMWRTWCQNPESR